jgi:hypothetical protein
LVASAEQERVRVDKKRAGPLAKAASMSLSVATFTIAICFPMARAAASNVLDWVVRDSKTNKTAAIG